MRFRFSLRSLTVLVAAVCFALWAIPRAMDWYYWHEVRVTIVDAMTDLATRHKEPSVFLGAVKGNEYYLANHEIKWDASQNAMVDSIDVHRNDAVFVTWPRRTGRWVSSLNEVMELIKTND